VVAKLEELYEAVGGFGSLLVFGFDYLENSAEWRNSLRLLAEEVAPRVSHLVPS
jgi:hypothetical protein